jgi:hypothetical protein
MINEIKFNYSSNIFLNSGILGLEYYLIDFMKHTEIIYEFELNKFYLLLKSNQLYKLLEDIYY